jgi:four helix bundle protein
MNAGFKDLKVYQLAYQSAMEIFNISKKFPKEEIYSLTDQIRRSSRSVCANIAEAYRKRRYPKNFTSKISDADGEASETTVWIDFALDCQYIDKKIHLSLLTKYEEIGKMLGSMADHPEKFKPKK